jgi:hypothetical protein
MAPKLFTESTEAERKTMTVTEGATIRGRLVQGEKPIANTEVGLTTHSRLAGNAYPEVRIGTQEDGRFAITNVPAGRIWNVYPKMASLAGRGIGADVVFCETKDDGQEVDVGDIQLKPTHRLRGTVVLGDGKPVPTDMRVILGTQTCLDSQELLSARTGVLNSKGCRLAFSTSLQASRDTVCRKGFRWKRW